MLIQWINVLKILSKLNYLLQVSVSKARKQFQWSMILMMLVSIELAGEYFFSLFENSDLENITVLFLIF